MKSNTIRDETKNELTDDKNIAANLKTYLEELYSTSDILEPLKHTDKTETDNSRENI